MMFQLNAFPVFVVLEKLLSKRIQTYFFIFIQSSPIAYEILSQNFLAEKKTEQNQSSYYYF